KRSSPCLAASRGSSRTSRPSIALRSGRGRGVQLLRSSGTHIFPSLTDGAQPPKNAALPLAPIWTNEMLHTIAAFDRLGEENAFAVLARATALAHEGRDIVNLGIGQPDFQTPPHIVEAAIKALRDGHHG